MNDAHHLALLRGDAAAARAEAAAELATATGARKRQLEAAMVFASVLDADFLSAHRIAESACSAGEDALTLAVAALARSMSGATVGPTVDDAVAAVVAMGTPSDERGLWAACLAGESAMSAGRLDLAETAAQLAFSGPVDLPSSAFAGQTLVRSLLFQGRLVEAAALGPDVLARTEQHGLAALGLVASAALAYVAVLRGDRRGLDDYLERVTAAAGSCPPSYLVNGSLILASYAMAADARAEDACRTLLQAGGGPELPQVQVVDRAYGYELLVTAALGVGDIAAAKEWAARADGLELPDQGMGAAAVRRTQARVIAAEGDGRAGSGLAQQARELAAANAGHLDATRAALLSGSVLLADATSAIAARAALVDAGGRAQDLGAVSLAVLARRDLRSIGLRFASDEQSQLTKREVEVAALVIAGLTNGQIGRTLGISERTVHTHVAGLLRALGLPSRTGVATALAAESEEPVDRGALTARQAEVADLVVQGYTNEGVGRALGVSVKTVEKHLGDAYRKLGVDSRTALASRWRA